MAPKTLTAAVISFAGVLRGHGFTMSIPEIMTALEGICEVGVTDRKDFFTVLKSAFLKHSYEELLFDHLLDEFWSMERIRRLEEMGGEGSDQSAARNNDDKYESLDFLVGDAGISEPQETHAWSTRPHCIYSPMERLKNQDLADIPAEEDQRMMRLIRTIINPLAHYPSWHKRDTSTGFDIDFRKMLRRNLRYGGETFELPRMKSKLKVKRIVFLCDVSGSMNPYLRFMLNFIKEIHHINPRVDTYIFATRLHRITQLLKHSSFPRAMASIAEVAQDWGGGTRIGESIGRFNSLRNTRASAASSVVIIYSDGWDRGDANQLDKEMSQLRRRCHKLIWINPLLGGSGYEPTCRGMRTALPYIDFFLPGHSIRALERLAKTISSLL